MAMLNNAVPMKAKRVARVMMGKGKDDDEDTQVYSSDESPEEADTAAPVQRQALVEPTARMQVFKRNNDVMFEPTPETKRVADIDESAHGTDMTNDGIYDEEDDMSDVSDKFRGRFGVYLHSNLMADLQELDCLQDMAKIVQAEVARFGTNLDAIFLVAYDLLLLRGVDAHTANFIASVVVRAEKW
jgi:hypothetical protein